MSKENPMRSVKIEKVVINIGAGEGGETLIKAEKVIGLLAKGRKPVRTISKITNKDLGIRKGMPIGCKLTIRGKEAEEFLEKALWTKENKIPYYSFDENGNLSFGIPEYTDFKGIKYRPDIGVFGMDVCITFSIPGFRIKHRKIARRRVPKRHRVTVEEAMEFMKKRFNLEIVE